MERRKGVEGRKDTAVVVRSCCSKAEMGLNPWAG